MTKIEWTQKTWNPITGCSKISEACANCYAEKMAKRLAGRYGYDKNNPFKVTIHKNKLDEPTQWTKPRMIFVCSMGDLFHPEVTISWIAEIFRIIRNNPQHTFQILTKRPQHMKKFLKEEKIIDRSFKWPLPNAWIGVTAENQKRAEERIPVLLTIPAAKRFVSCEPLLDWMDLTKIKTDPYRLNVLTGGYHDECDSKILRIYSNNKIDWVIAGGESGTNARPSHPMWFQLLRTQCEVFDVPFFFKQHGEWIAKTQWNKPFDGKFCALDIYGNRFDQTSTWNGRQLDPSNDYEVTMYKIGKKAAECLLDGKEYKEYPK